MICSSGSGSRSGKPPAAKAAAEAYTAAAQQAAASLQRAKRSEKNGHMSIVAGAVDKKKFCVTPATCGTHANTSSSPAALLPLAAAAAGTVCASSARTARLEWEEEGHQKYVHTATDTIKSTCPVKRAPLF